jgi:hypothetical protein
VGQIKESMLAEVEDPPEWESPEYVLVPTEEFKALYAVLIRADDFVNEKNDTMRLAYEEFLASNVKKYREIEKKQRG